MKFDTKNKMTTQINQKEEIKREIVSFAIQEVEKFLKENPNGEFYTFAFDCDAKDAEINLSFNTEFDFQNTLEFYQNEYSGHYLLEQEIRALKFRPGKWEYHCSNTLYVITEEELDKIFMELSGYEDVNSIFEDDDNEEKPLWKEFLKNLLELFTESLVEFTKTETYKKIPKTQDFVAFCIDYKEDFEQAMERLKMLQPQNQIDG